MLRSLIVCFSVALGLVAFAACSDDTCNSADCAAGNQCLPYKGQTSCRKTCSSNDVPATSCPFGYTCTDTQGGVPAFCVQSTALLPNKQPIVPNGKGQWGAPCQGNGGVTNAKCDADQGFFCYAQSPADADGYCTRYSCTTNTDCGPGFYCGAINETPNADKSKRLSIGSVISICLRRTFCSPCVADLDCLTTPNAKQHCITDASGVGMCTSECSDSSNCNDEAKCVDAGIGVKVCYPRATVCVGDGSLCSPCRNDNDCGDDGACVKGEFTTEHSCAKKSTKSCAKGTSRGSCVDKLDKPAVSVSCAGGIIDDVPNDFCHGLYAFGSQTADVGCWTATK